MTTAISTLTLRSSVAPTSTSGYAFKDRLLSGANGGVRFLADGNHPSSWPSNAAPVNGSSLIDLAGNGNAAWAIGSGETVSYSGNGFDFSAATAVDDYFSVPASVAANIWGAGSGATATASSSGVPTVTAGGTAYVQGEAQAVFSGGGLSTPVTVTCTVAAGAVTAIPTPSASFTSAPTVAIVPSPQYFMAVIYVKLPASADWNPSSAVTVPFFQFGEGSMLTNADMGNCGQTVVGGIKQITAYRPFNLAMREQVSLNVGAADYGTLAQLAIWRNASGFNVRMKTAGQVANGLPVALANIASPNPAIVSFAARTGRFGFTSPYQVFSALGTCYKYKSYRGFVANLRTDIRDPVSGILDPDWTRAAARPYA